MSYAYSWLNACNTTARVGAEPSLTQLLWITVLGNPVMSETALVEIRGRAGDRLQLRLIDSRSYVLSETIITQAQPVERHSIKLNGPTGLYLLKVSTPTQSGVVKLIRQ